MAANRIILTIYYF